MFIPSEGSVVLTFLIPTLVKGEFNLPTNQYREGFVEFAMTNYCV
jgi:hypothetical protein